MGTGDTGGFEQRMAQVVALGSRLCRLSIELLGAETSWTLLEDRSREVFVRVAGDGLPASQDGTGPPRGVPRGVLRPLLGRLARDGVVQDTEDLHPLLAGTRGRGSLCMGLQHGDSVVGLQVALRREHFPPGAPGLARLIAEIGSLGIANHALRAQLERAWNASSEYLANASHGLRTPLNVILGYAEMARDPETATAEQARYIDLIAQYAGILANAVDALCRAAHVVIPSPEGARASTVHRAAEHVPSETPGPTGVPELLGAIRATTQGVRRLYGVASTRASTALSRAASVFTGELTSTGPRQRAGSSP